ncbi:glycosyltransferase [Exilibacterium tricleocarpae]|uniref:Glycosyltransferase n=1 Tax=Exilibacterium tricleocarpae TaxID=2591008 RepID=A0A545T8I3_9GAMM|nr:MJ1255/VC2487 family glycosyltransferase [Exilibacterium tricleocarpae]TQV73495.1 glycosyltransferase [Exilibacterium tricleocarpae]
MKILYGVQATGNGHITRARAISAALENTDLQVDYLFSGRERDKFFDMKQFGDWRCLSGMTFVHQEGKIDNLRTLRHNKILQFFRDIRELPVDDYDLVITDFEPVSAWAARRAGKTCIGIGHQYAFDYPIPLRGSTLSSRMIMRHFAPASLSLGLHWHHFGHNILPPIADIPAGAGRHVDPRKIVVYLGFESPQKVMSLLEPMEDYIFYYYGEFERHEDRGNIQLRPLSRSGFQQDLHTCSGVISNAGFELASEAIQLGKKLLAKPLQGQMEQLSNAAALEQLGLGMTMNSLDAGTIRHWLDDWKGPQVVYPDVAGAIVDWLVAGDWKDSSNLVTNLWAQVESPDIADFAANPKPTTSATLAANTGRAA